MEVIFHNSRQRFCISCHTRFRCRIARTVTTNPHPRLLALHQEVERHAQQHIEHDLGGLVFRQERRRCGYDKRASEPRSERQDAVGQGLHGSGALGGGQIGKIATAHGRKGEGGGDAGQRQDPECSGKSQRVGDASGQDRPRSQPDQVVC